LGYTAARDPAYLESVTAWLKRRYALAATAEQVVYCRGANTALLMSVLAFSQPGQGVIIQPPVFQYFAGAVQRNGRALVENHLLQDAKGAYHMDFAGLEELAARPENVLLLLCNPNNPTGNLWGEEDLRRLGAICLRHGVKVVSDEVHLEIVRQGLPAVALAPLFAESDQIITIISLSKGFNMAGLQNCHVVIPNATDREAFQKELGRQGPGPLDIAATIAAYTAADDWLSQVNAYIDGNIAFFDQFMAKELPQVPYVSPQATYMVWLDLRLLGLEPEALQSQLREKAGLQLNNGASYGSAGAGYVRVNLATPRFVLGEALQRLKKFFVN